MGEKEDDINLIGDHIDHHRVVRHIQGSGDLLCACGKRFPSEADFLAHRPPDYDPNPYPEEEPWRDLHTAFENGQLHPSPQTIKKIQTNFAEKVNEAIRQKFFPWQSQDRRVGMTLNAIEGEIDNTLKQQNEGGE